MTFLAAALWLSAGPAAADLSLVRIVQSQNSKGDEGLFGKTLVEVSGRKMRLVSGTARKAGSDAQEPTRLVEVLDLQTTSLLLIDPESKSFKRLPLAAKPAAAAVGRAWRVTGSTVKIAPGKVKRRFLDTLCDHYRLTATLELRQDKKKVRARLEQDVWMAPPSGELQKGLLDLMAFEADYRRVTGEALTPLDRGTYQLADAAAYLEVPEADLAKVIEQARAAFTNLPGYPISSSAAWRREEESKPKKRWFARTKKEPEVEPRFMQDPPPAKPFLRRRLRPIDFRRSWKQIDDAIAGRGMWTGDFPMGGLPPRWEDHQEFRAEMRDVMQALDAMAVAVMVASPDEGPKGEKPGKKLAPEPVAPKDKPLPEHPRREKPDNAPFYEVYSTVGELAFVPQLPQSRFAPPAGFSAR